jgi:hypothetical protein
MMFNRRSPLYFTYSEDSARGELGTPKVSKAKVDLSLPFPGCVSADLGIRQIETPGAYKFGAGRIFEALNSRENLIHSFQWTSGGISRTP